LLRKGRWIAACLGVVVLWACGPVYVPVPPPSQISFTADLVTDSAGVTHTEWITAGGPNDKAANGRYFVFDLDQNGGVIAPAMSDGSFVAPSMPGTAGDRVSVYYEDTLGHPSASSCRVLGEERPFAASCP